MDQTNPMPIRFTVASHGNDRLGLRDWFERFANDLWIPAHLTPQQAAEFARQQFERTIAAELEMLEVVCEVKV